MFIFLATYEIDEIIAFFGVDMLLTGDKSEAFPHLKQEFLKVINYGLLKIRLPIR